MAGASHDLQPPFTLLPSERASPLWQKLTSYMEDKLREARGQNDGDLDIAATARLRGKIQCYKSLLALGVEQPPTE